MRLHAPATVLVALFFFTTFAAAQAKQPTQSKPETPPKQAGGSATAIPQKTTPTSSGSSGKPTKTKKPSVAPPPPVAPVAKLLVIPGSFTWFTESSSAKTDISKCKQDKNCIQVIAANGTSLDPSPILVNLTDSELDFSYTPKSSTADPAADVFFGNPGAQKRYSVSSTPVPVLPTHSVILTGDFCQLKDSQCQTGFNVMSDIDHAQISDSNNMTVGAEVTAYDKINNTVAVTYDAAVGFQPMWVQLYKANGAGGSPFAFVVAPPVVTSQAVYQDFALRSFCPQNTSGISLTPLGTPVGKVELISVKDSLLFARIIGQSGKEPETLIAVCGNQQLLLRRVAKTDADQSLLDVHMTVMDQETVQRSYGTRVANHFIAVQLDLLNRTAKKLTFNKSDIWFETDLRAVGTPRPRIIAGFGSIATAGTYTPQVSGEHFKSYGPHDAEICRHALGNRLYKHDDTNAATTQILDPINDVCNQTLFRYGIEQSAHITPYNYLTILSAFDYTTETTDRWMRLIELIGATLLPISGGSIVAQVNNTAFHDSISVFTGTFLPAYRALALDPARINRMRSNLVSQTLQETIQIAPNAAANTIVLLPRDGIIAVRGADLPVAIDRLVDVHVDPDVVNGVKDPPVPANHVELKYTKDQVRQSLGEPFSVTTDTTGAAIFTYATGGFADVHFDVTGLVNSWDVRSLQDQLELQKTLADSVKLLQSGNTPYTELTLLNNGFVLVDIPGVVDILQYDSKGSHVAADYTLLFSKISSFVGQTPAALSTYLASVHIGSTWTAPDLKKVINGMVTFPSPDIQGDTIAVTLTKDSPPNIATITFTGPRPSDVK